jgi:hypothetical protein
MRHRCFTVVLTVAWAISAATGGCAAKRVSPATQPSALAAPATQPAAINVPLVYSSYFEPEQLNNAQLHEINTVLAEIDSEVGEPWFIYVRYSRDGNYRVSVYFKPTALHGGISHGQAVYFDNDMPIDRRRQFAKQLGDTAWPAPHPYVQVPREGLDQGAIPAEWDMPISPPDGITNEELLKIVGTARNAATKNDASAAQMPVRNIEVNKDGTVHVFFGWQAGGLNGRGVFVELKREGTGFAAPSVGMWAS